MNFFKEFYINLIDLSHGFLGIESNFFGHVFAIMIFLIILSFFALLIKTIAIYVNIKRKNLQYKINLDKAFLKLINKKEDKND